MTILMTFLRSCICSSMCIGAQTSILQVGMASHSTIWQLSRRHLPTGRICAWQIVRRMRTMESRDKCIITEKNATMVEKMKGAR